MTFDDGIVSFVGFTVLELLAEHGLSLGVFRENDDSTGVAVKAMNEETVIFEGWLGAVFAFRHAEKAGGLVDDEDVVVFVDDGWTRRSFCSFGNCQGDFCGFLELRVRFGDGLTVDGDVARLDELLEAGAVVFGMLLDEEMVEAVFLGGFVGLRQFSIAVDDAREAGFAELFAGDDHFVIPCLWFLGF